MNSVKRTVLAMTVLLAVAGAYFFFQPSGGNAPAAARGDAGHAHSESEGKVILGEAKLAAAGIELVKAGPSVLHESILLNGIFLPNQETLAQVTPRFPGIVREVVKRVGDRIDKNDLLAKIESNQSLTTYELRAPFSGTVIERNAALGEFVSEQKPVFIVADLSSVWADFAVYRRDLGRIAQGNTVVISGDDNHQPMESTISYVAPVGSADTQTATARAIIANTEQKLRPGLFVTGRVLLSAKPVALSVKATALQTVKNRTVVFVRSGDAFEAREVELGNRDAEHVEVLFGLVEGDVYAAKNSFVIKAELGKASAEHEH